MTTTEGAQLASMTGEPMTLKEVRVDGVLSGALFEATVTQRFRNPGSAHAEVVYTFPLPFAATLLDVDVELGGRHLAGTVLEKRQAEAGYEEALSEGDAAIMLEQNGDGSFTLNLGNLAPGECCVIRLRYAQALAFEQGGLRVLIPTVIAPRYGHPLANGRLQPHQTVEHDLVVAYPFELSLRLEGALARAHVASPSHPIGVRLNEDGALAVRLARTGALDRDFVLVVSELAQASIAISGSDPAEEGCAVVQASFCPRGGDADASPVAVKLLVDCSGSMQGDSIVAARAALMSIVAQLRGEDRFSLSRFGSSVEHRSRGLWRATEAAQLSAQRWVGELDADLGGTAMESALQSTFALPHEGSCDVLLITDGAVTEVDEIVAAARAGKHRVFVVGIGSSVSEGLLRRLAEATGGACDFVAPGEAVEPAVLRMFARLRAPKFFALEVRWPEGAAPVWQAGLRGALFAGDTATLYAGFATPIEGEVVLFGQREGEAGKIELGRACIERRDASDAVARMGGAARLNQLDPVERGSGTAVSLALAYRLVSCWTNFLLVEARPEGEKAREMPELVKVRSMMPAGYAGTGSVLFSRRRVESVSLKSAQFSYDVPAVIRRGSAAHAAIEPAACYDIPAFLRRDASDSDTGRSESVVTLTPAEFADWLQREDVSRWPSTYAELRAAGLPGAVVDWLEFMAGSGFAEPDVVAAFVWRMADVVLNESLWKSVGMSDSLARIASELARRARLAAKAPAMSPEITVRLEPVFDALVAECWPAFMNTPVPRVAEAGG